MLHDDNKHCYICDRKLTTIERSNPYYMRGARDILLCYRCAKLIAERIHHPSCSPPEKDYAAMESETEKCHRCGNPIAIERWRIFGSERIYCSRLCADLARNLLYLYQEPKRDSAEVKDPYNPKDAVGVRTADTGATRDVNTTKFSYDGFLSPFTLREFAEYMHRHRTQADGSLRSSDNWQKGMPVEWYRDSMWRHFMDVWCILRGHPDLAGQATDQTPPDIMEALCGLYFNVGGLIHEISKKRRTREDA